METYKDINRALTLQNQELRQQVAYFKQEIVELNRKLMTEKQIVQVFNRRYMRLIGEMSKLCNEAMREFNRSIQEIMPESSDTLQSEISQNKSKSRRSVRLVPPTLRRLQDEECEKENINPLTNDVDNTQISYVQTRRRRKDDNASSQSEYIPQTFVETINSSVGLEGSKESDKSIEDSSDSVRRDIHTIREENTADISPSVSAVTGGSVESLSHSSIVEESCLEPVPNYPERTRGYNNNQHIPSIIVTDSSTDQITQFDIQDNVSAPTQLIEDTIFNNFRTFKAVCSTPYKPSDPRTIRNCIIKIKKLSSADLQRHGVTNADGKLTLQHNHNKRRQNISSLNQFIRISSPRISASKVLIERLSGLTSEIRPKRNAAPMNLKEPTINKKMRREL